MPDDDEHFTEDEEFAFRQADAEAITKEEEEAIDATADDPTQPPPEDVN